MKYTRLILCFAVIMFTGLVAFQSSHTEAFDPFNRLPNTAKVKKLCSTANTNTSPGCKKYTANPFAGNNGVIIRAALIVDWVVGVTAVAVMMYAGFLFMTSRGDVQKTITARQTMLYASVGVVVALAGQAIIAFGLNRLLL